MQNHHERALLCNIPNIFDLVARRHQTCFSNLDARTGLAQARRVVVRPDLAGATSNELVNKPVCFGQGNRFARFHLRSK
jgi:hypothetical protein